jgi:hypothetical protein
MSNLDAPELLRAALSMYEKMSSYQDDGVVVVASPKLESRDRVSFETLFVRPSLFRFKFASPHPYPPLAHIITTTICGLDEMGAYMWSKNYDAPATLKDCENISMAVAAATGISSGSAHNIGQLLFAQVGGARFADLDSLSLRTDETVEGVPCKSLHGSVPRADADVTLFIDPETLIIPRIDTRFAQFSSQEIRRNIRINETIDSSRMTRPNGEI